MKICKYIAWIALLAFGVIQLFPVAYNSYETVPKTDFMLVNKVPVTIEKSLQVSCYDCHSNNTQYPWYNKIQPAAWYLEEHIQEGKSELNFSEWATYSDRRKTSKLRAIIKQIENEEMPLESYTLVHGAAVLSTSKKEEIIKYITNLKESLE